MRLKDALVIVLAAVALGLAGCASDPPPPPELTPAMAAAAITQKWSQGEMNHFRVTFHSETLVECGVQHDLWQLADLTDASGKTWGSAYRLTAKGSQLLTSINLQKSGLGHQILLRGPYRIEINGITDGSQPNTKNVAFRWDIDWDKAAADLKACLPRFELSGNQAAVFQLDGDGWHFLSYLNPEDITVPQDGAPAAPSVASPAGR